MLTTELVEQVLTTVPNRMIGVLGDLFLDRYLDIDAARNEPSIETGLTAYQVVQVRSYPGAAGTVINNLAALGVGRIYPIAFIGDDGEGYELRQALKTMPAVELGGVVPVPDRRTPTYTKPMLNEPGQPPRELNRLDIKNRIPTSEGVQDHIIDLLDEVWPQLDALIVLDQVSEVDCGVITRRVRDKLAELGQRFPEKFILADSREQIGLFRHVCVKPNEPECAAAVAGLPAFTAAGLTPALESIAKLVSRVHRDVFCTSGNLGITWGRYVRGDTADAGTIMTHIPAYPVGGPIDICGAGDSCSAGITAAMVSGLTPEQAAAFGNLIASITIQQIGVTGTAPPDRVRARWHEIQASLSRP